MALLVFIPLNLLSAGELPVELGERSFYVKDSFSPEDTLFFPPKGEGWEKVQPGDLHSGLYAPMRDKEYSEFTMTGSFFVNESISNGYSLALYLPAVGPFWEIYINGRLIGGETPGPGRKEKISYFSRNRVIEIPSIYLKQDFNVIAFHLEGDFSSPLSGLAFYNPGPVINKSSLLYKKQQNRERSGLFFLSFALFILVFSLTGLIALKKDRFFWAIHLVSAAALLAYITAGFNLFYLFFRNSYYEPLVINLAPFVVWAGILLMVNLFSFGRRGKELYISTALFVTGSAGLIFFSAQPEIIFTLFTTLECILFISLFLIKSGTFLSHQGIWGLIRSVFRFTLSSPLVVFAGSAFAALIIKEAFHSRETLIISFFLLFLFFYMIYLIVENPLLKKFKAEEAGIDERLASSNRQIEALLEDLKNEKERSSSFKDDLEGVQKQSRLDIQITSVVQKYIFPTVAPESGDYEVALYAEGGKGLGFTMYDFYVHDNSLKGLSLFEPTNSGLSASLVTILSRSMLYRRFIQLLGYRLSSIVEKFNRDLHTELADMDIFLSGQILKFSDNEVEYINAGHTDLLYRSASKEAVRPVAPAHLQYKSTMIGSVTGMEQFNTVKFKLNRGDYILLYSEGYPRSANLAGESYGMEEIYDVFENIPASRGAQESLAYITKNLKNYTQKVSSNKDVTIILVKKK
jgi:serine phosphatase RsbU (regulator of sigma subunit)